MAKIRIELHEENADGLEVVNVFENPDTRGKDHRKALETINKLSQSGLNRLDELEIMLEFAVFIFDKHNLTSDRILEGLYSEEVDKTLSGIINDVTGIGKETEKGGKK